MVNRSFASDNYAGVHPEIMKALQEANSGHEPSYGADQYTARAEALFKKHFGESAEIFFVYNGTGANILGLSLLTRSFNSILCPALAHINVDESTGPEKFLGCKLIPINTTDGKLHAAAVEEHIQRLDDQHHPQVKVISISQTTEYGTVYSIDEIKALSRLARKYNLFLHMDGSRIANAAVSLDTGFASFTRDAGVDVLSFGGTKNGMMFGEAVVVFNPSLAKDLKFHRKQGMQLHSKMRFISAQFEALMTNDLWKRNARHANVMARKLEHELKKLPVVSITQPVQANGIFASMPRELISELQKSFFVYVWNEKISEVRIMCSFATTDEDVTGFAQRVRELS